ncbi:MAG: UGSC family (seleno)protein, partial [Candidatus Binatia bacterium]
TTTGNIAPLAIVNGPCRNALAINYGANVLGQGWRANATIGRAIRFIMTNIGGARPGSFDKSTMGQPAKFTFCFAENEEESPWQPFHVERGLARDCDTVHMFGASGVYSAVDMASQSATGLLKTFALTMTGGLASGVTSTEVLWVICPEHAAILARDGYSKAKLRQALFAQARVPSDKIADENLELLAKRRPLWFKQGGLREVGVVDRPEDIWLVVAGGAGAKSAYIPGRTATRMQTVAVREGGVE